MLTGKTVKAKTPEIHDTTYQLKIVSRRNNHPTKLDPHKLRCEQCNHSFWVNREDFE